MAQRCTGGGAFSLSLSVLMDELAIGCCSVPGVREETSTPLATIPYRFLSLNRSVQIYAHYTYATDLQQIKCAVLGGETGKRRKGRNECIGNGTSARSF